VALAKEQGVSESDIDLGNVSRAELADPIIADTAFSLEVNKVSEPVTNNWKRRLAARHGNRAGKTRP
jgi:peptidyl-prolyl cis-trans isomerase D